MHVAKLLCTLTAVILLDACQLNTRTAIAPARPGHPAESPLPASSQAWRWQGGSRQLTLPGSSALQKRTLVDVLARTDTAETTALLLAANSALKLKRIDDAGFLYNAAQVRHTQDLARFPPLDAERPWLQRIDALRVDTGKQVSSALLDTPKAYGRVAKRLASWRCETRQDYLPAWRSRHQRAAGDCQALSRERASALQDIATLMDIPSYAEAARLARYYLNGSASVRALPGLKEQYRDALAEMQRIERNKGLYGLSTRMR